MKKKLHCKDNTICTMASNRECYLPVVLTGDNALKNSNKLLSKDFKKRREKLGLDCNLAVGL